MKTTFKDLPGWYAEPYNTDLENNAFYIFRPNNKREVAYYEEGKILLRKDILVRLGEDVEKRNWHSCKNLHQGMRLAFLLTQRPR